MVEVLCECDQHSAEDVAPLSVERALVRHDSVVTALVDECVPRAPSLGARRDSTNVLVTNGIVLVHGERRGTVAYGNRRCSAIVLSSARDDAGSLLDHLTSTEMQTILGRYGFTPAPTLPAPR